MANSGAGHGRGSKHAPRGGRRQAKLRQRDDRFGRFLFLTGLGSLIPGLGLLAAGRRGWGKFVLTIVLLGLLGLGVVLWRVPRQELAFSALNRDVLTMATAGLVVVGLGWLIVALASHRALEPDGLSGGKRFAGSIVVIVTASLVVSPLAIAAKYALSANDLFDAVWRPSSTAPEDVDKHNFWEDMPRVNVLLLGSDAGEGRHGVRPDTLILASIDTGTGDTTMFSLPRNLERVPFPAGSELAQHYPDGFTSYQREDDNFFLNAVYNHIPSPGYLPPGVAEEIFAGSDDPGADATKLAVAGALGLDVHYYVMVNLDGFQDVVAAMGGITIDVPYPIPLGTKVADGPGDVPAPDGSNCTRPRAYGTAEYPNGRWILPGEDVELTGGEALWFARSRCAPTHPDYPDLTGKNSPITHNADYNRMDRQRCVISAVADRADPLNLLTNFESLAAATEKNVATDIPLDLWSTFAELAVDVKGASMLSLPLTKDVIMQGTPDYSTPNYVLIHDLVQEALTPEPDISSTTDITAEAGSEEESSAGAGETSEPEIVVEDVETSCGA